jgi:hypothetical protein
VSVTVHNLFHTVEGLVAVGTIALAFVTGVLAAATLRMASQTKSLAKSTQSEVKTVGEEIELSRESLHAMRDQAESTRDQARFAQMALEATFRPILISVPAYWPNLKIGGKEVFSYENGPLVEIDPTRRHSVDYRTSGDSIFVSMLVRNAGPGIAFIKGTTFHWRVLEGVTGTFSNGIVPPGEPARLLFSLLPDGSDDPLTPEVLANYGSFTIWVVYEDLGGHEWRTELDVQRRDDERWVVRQVWVGTGMGRANMVATGFMSLWAS